MKNRLLNFLLIGIRRTFIPLFCLSAPIASAVIWCDGQFSESANGLTWNYLYFGSGSYVGSYDDRFTPRFAIVGMNWVYNYYGNFKATTESPQGKVVIPSTLGGAPLIQIGYKAFEGFSGITDIQIPEGVDELEKYSFSGCSSMTNVALPHTLAYVGERAFKNCIALKSVSIQDPIHRVLGIDAYVSLGRGVFENCSSLTSVVLPDRLSDLGDYTFANCSQLRIIRSNATWFGLCRSISSFSRIGSHCFFNCSSLLGHATSFTTFNIPSGVCEIGDSAFEGCSSLQGFSIPRSVTNIGARAFCNCTSLTSLVVPDTVSFIGENAVGGCIGLKRIQLPESFKGNTDSLGIPEGCMVCFGDPATLTVVSDMGYPSPGIGENVLWKGAEVFCSAREPVPDATRPGYQRACIGWTGTGSVPESGSEPEFQFVLLEDSVLRWLWGTNVLIECAISGDVDSFVVSQWQRQGTALTISVGSLPESCSAVFSGEADGVTFDPETSAITVPADRPRSLSARIHAGNKLFSDKPLSLLSGGDVEWSLVGESSSPDGYCLRSGSISQGETSTIEMQVESGGALSFDWKISANRSDWAYFFVDDVQAASITRATDWTNVSTNLANGTHVLRWVFDRHAATAANDEAAFLDNVSWRPRLSLTVSSDYGTATPAVGTSLVSYGDLVSASVVAPASANGTRRVCTGWTGTGSIPAQGTTAAFPFVLTKPSTLVWQWRTDRWIDVAVVAGGTTSFQPQWIENGKTVSVSVVPDTHLYRVSLAGDTEGVSVSGTTITFVADRPRTIRVTVEEVKLSLSVVSEHGSCSPERGLHAYSWGVPVSVMAFAPEPENGFRYRCKGWRGTGSVPEGGSESDVLFYMEEDSSITWLWQTNVWVALSVEGAAVVDVSGQWVEIGDSLVVPYAPLSDFTTFAIGGDANGVVIDQETNTITIPADRPRSVSVTATAMSLASALDAKGLVWTTSGGDVWIPQRTISSDGVDAAASGDATGSDNLLETSVLGPGTLSWFWKMNASGWAGVDASVDGRDVAYLETSGDWTSASTQISGEGSHAVRFAFWTEEGCTPSDRAYIDRVSWTGATIPRATQTTPEAVPYSWLDRWPGLLAENGGDYERAAAAIAANGINTVWECYVAGLDPTDPSAAFRVDISMNGDEPRIDWTPDLGTARDYRLEGQTEFGDIDGWKSPVTDDHRFFRARVALPDASGSVEEDDAFPGFVTVTFDANGGTVETQSKDYTTTGTLGTLPVPSWNDIPFLGWYSAPTGGVRLTQQTPVPYRNTRIFAQWNYWNIRFDANGGSGAMDVIQYSVRPESHLPENLFSKKGYSFSGWALSPNGEVVCGDGGFLPSGVSEAESHLVLYAKWKPNCCAFKFNANGGTGTMPTMQLNTGDMLPRNVFVHEGRFFEGWATNQFGGVAFKDCEVLVNDCSERTITLYAVWSEYFPGLSVRYYDISSSGYSTWMESEAAMKSYFDEKTPTIATNTLDWIAGLDAGFSNSTGSDGNRWVSSGMTRPNATCLFHGEYASSSREQFAALLVGHLSVTDSDMYQFAAVADDAVILYIDGTKVLENEQNWGNMATGEIELSTGCHSVSIGFYETTGGQGLSVQWKKAGDSSYVPIPQSALKHCHEQLIFDANGGSGIMPSAFLNCSSRIEELPECDFSRGEWTFVGWARTFDGRVEWQDRERNPQKLPVYNGVAKLFARWSESVCSVHFDANGGYGTMPDMVVGKDLPPQQFPSNLFEKDGFVFSGWNTNRTSKGLYGNADFLPIARDSDDAVTFYATWIPVDDWTWSVSGDKATITGSAFTTGGVAIPKVLNGLVVTSIGYEAFQDCSGLTSITMPNSVMSIGINAFKGCSGLTSITIPDSVTSIGEGAFWGCSGLTSITIPNSVTFIGGDAFNGCSGLTSITIPDSITSLGYYAFAGCSGLTSITIPDSVVGIGDGVFAYCSGLSSITIPNSVTSIGYEAFAECSGLTSITIPDSVTSIGNKAFRGCSGLTSATIGSGVNKIDDWAFYDCSNLSSITIADGLKRIGSYVFHSCPNLKQVFIPDSVTGISDLAFWYSGLTLISLPAHFEGQTANWDLPNGCTLFFRTPYTIHFDANGGNGTMDNLENCTKYGNVNLPECGFFREGWTFAGWSRSSDGLIEWTNGQMVEGGFYSFASEGVATLFARWARGSFTVHFDANGGTGAMPDATLWSDAPQKLSNNVFLKDGAWFSGWATNGTDDVVFTDGETVCNLVGTGETVVLHAVWSSDPPAYMVVDLSGGPSAESYPITYLAKPPPGGFNADEFKTTKLVLRCLEPGPIPTRDVAITKRFFIGLFEVTQKQWELVMWTNPSYSAFSGETRPVECVSYNNIRGSSLGSQWPASDAVDSDSFLGRLRERTGLGFDLPTESQWEYACRAGTTTTFSYGDSADGNYMWYEGNSSWRPQEVGTTLPNAWGLYDMHGNVGEWCLDWSSSSQRYRVICGGSWYDTADRCASSNKDFGVPSDSDYCWGFRLARTLSE